MNMTNHKQRQQRDREVDREVLRLAAAAHSRFARHYLCAGHVDLAYQEAIRAQAALKMAREIV
jgi:hypothetical protein